MSSWLVSFETGSLELDARVSRELKKRKHLNKKSLLLLLLLYTIIVLFNVRARVYSLLVSAPKIEYK